MAFYADQMFYSRDIAPAPALMTASLTGTGTAVVNAITPSYALHPFFRNTAVNKLQLTITSAATAGEAVVWNFYVGTGTTPFATIVPGTSAAGVIVTGTVSNTGGLPPILPAGAQITGTATGTATSAGVGAGIGQLWFELQETYNSTD